MKPSFLHTVDGRHALTLRFADKELEADYRRKMVPRARQQLRFSLQSSIPLWLILGLVLYPRIEGGTAILVSVPVVCGFLLGLLAVERRVARLGTLHALGLLSNTVLGLATVAVVWLEGLFEHAGPISVLSTAAYSFTMLNLPFVTSLVAVAPYVLACVALTLALPAMALPVFQATLLLITASVLATSAYMREAAQRRDFKLTRVIADKDRALEQAAAKQLGQYTLLGQVGKGGMGVVYRARHAMLRRPTAVKLLTAADATPAQLALFEREVQLTSELSHPNIVSIYDYGRSPDGEFYYAMEYLPGIDLQSLVDRWGPMPAERVVPILRQVCGALDAAHHRGLVHRDIKPGNIILSRFGPSYDVVRVVDFGLVREIETAGSVAADPSVAGTPGYMAPETVTSPHPIGPSVDLYAVGAVAFFLLTGRPVFTGATHDEVLARHVRTAPTAPSSQARYPVPAELDAWVTRLLAKKPSQRFGSAAEARDALRAVPVEAWPGAADWWEMFEITRSADESGETLEEGFALTVDMRDRAVALTDA